MLALVLLVLAVILYFSIRFIGGFYGSKIKSTIPGPCVKDPLQGHLADIAASGGLNDFLKGLHHKYGPIVSFSLGPTFCVSIASPGLFKEQAKVFDRPKQLFEMIEPLISQHSIQFSNGPEARKRHTAYSRCFSHELLRKRFHILKKLPMLSIQLASEKCTKWASLASGQHIPLTEEMYAMSIQGILGLAFGAKFEDQKEAIKFKKAYDVARLVDNVVDAKREEKFQKHKRILNTMLREALESSGNIDSEGDMFVNVVREINDSQDVIDADMLTVCIGGFHTTSLLMAWCLYFLATYPDIQDKVYREVTGLVGEEDIPFDAIKRMKYLRQVLDETLRCCFLAAFSARVQDKESELGGHKIPAGTPVIHALGVIMEDATLWPNPDKFDPDRFSDENRKSLPSCAFEPFGFAGKRKCPGYRLSYLEASLLVAQVISKFKVCLVPGQKVELYHGLVTRPKDEIWITVEKRKEKLYEYR